MPNRYEKFKAGIYQHYKGPHYQVLGLAHDSNHENRVVIVYIGLELDKAKPGPRLGVRTYEDFYSWVDPKTGKVVDEKESGATPRFRYIGQTLEA